MIDIHMFNKHQHRVCWIKHIFTAAGVHGEPGRCWGLQMWQIPLHFVLFCKSIEFHCEIFQPEYKSGLFLVTMFCFNHLDFKKQKSMNHGSRMVSCWTLAREFLQIQIAQRSAKGENNRDVWLNFLYIEQEPPSSVTWYPHRNNKQLHFGKFERHN